MSRVAIGWSSCFADYEAPPGHPERSGRSHAVGAAVRQLGARVQPYELAPATLEQLTAIHHPRYVEALSATESAPRPVVLDADTTASAGAYQAARLAAGAAVGAVDAVFRGGARRALSLARPPGHHAEVDRAMGFCFFNNVAVATQHALDVYGVRRAAVVDFDVHHGNGTQRAFEGRSDVLFISSHQVKLFPGTGQPKERGRGAGLGYTLNLPLPHEATDDDLIGLHRHVTLPVLEAFRPELLMISAGFDAHAEDHTAAQHVTSRGFGQLAALLFDAADRLCEGRAVLVLEGGYALDALTECVVAVAEAALEPRAWLEAAPPPRGKLKLVIDALQELHAPAWPTLGTARRSPPESCRAGSAPDLARPGR